MYGGSYILISRQRISTTSKIKELAIKIKSLLSIYSGKLSACLNKIVLHFIK